MFYPVGSDHVLQECGVPWAGQLFPQFPATTRKPGGGTAVNRRTPSYASGMLRGKGFPPGVLRAGQWQKTQERAHQEILGLSQQGGHGQLLRATACQYTGSLRHDKRMNPSVLFNRSGTCFKKIILLPNILSDEG